MSFIKHNGSRFKDQLIKEAEGLELLRQTIESNNINLRVPYVLEVSGQKLELQLINATRPTQFQMETLGRELAKLHNIKMELFGLEQNNYIGLNPQENTLSQDWGKFFYKKRLKPQVDMITSPRVRNYFLDTLNSKKSQLIDWLNEHCEHPSLVHGDLWSGNVMFDKQDVWLIDPAVYYGDRDVDLAMTEMFGGFSHHFYSAYDEILPRTDDYDTKKKVYNLYHYLNHFNLFGEGYLSECQRGMDIIKQL